MLIWFPPIKYSSLLITLEAKIVYLRLQYILGRTRFVFFSREKKTVNILVVGRKFSFTCGDI